MPRSQNYRQFSELERGRIIGLHGAGMRFCEITRQVERNNAK